MEGKLNLFESCMSHCLLKNLLEILYEATKMGVVLIVDNIDCPVHWAGIDNIPATHSKEYIQSPLNDWLAVLGFEREKKLEL